MQRSETIDESRQISRSAQRLTAEADLADQIAERRILLNRVGTRFQNEAIRALRRERTSSPIRGLEAERLHTEATQAPCAN
jgi:hypothetical protein